MTQAEKLTKLKTLLNITGTEQDATLTVFLELSKSEILAWLYSGKTPEGVTDVPAQYEPTQVMACVAGFSQGGAEGQIAHSENGISRTWKYEDMVAYIRSRVCAYVQVI
jgi:hypothetical protein